MYSNSSLQSSNQAVFVHCPEQVMKWIINHNQSSTSNNGQKIHKLFCHLFKEQMHNIDSRDKCE